MSIKTPESHDNLLVLSGPVTLYESSAVRDLLVGAVAEATALEIDLRATGPWDLAGLQLLVSAVASGTKAGGPVHLIHVPRVCQEVADRSGLADWLKTVIDSSQ